MSAHRHTLTHTQAQRHPYHSQTSFYLSHLPKLIMSVFVLQGARGNDGAAGAAGPPVSIFFFPFK